MVVVHLVSQVRFLLCHDVRRSTSIRTENLVYSSSIVSLFEASNTCPSGLKISCIRLLLSHFLKLQHLSIGTENLVYSFSIVSLVEASNTCPSGLKLSSIRLL